MAIPRLILLSTRTVTPNDMNAPVAIGFRLADVVIAFQFTFGFEEVSRSHMIQFVELLHSVNARHDCTTPSEILHLRKLQSFMVGSRESLSITEENLFNR